MLGLGSSVTKSGDIWPLREAGATGNGATVPKKLANVGILRNAGIHRRAAAEMLGGANCGTEHASFVAGAARW